MDRKSPTRRIFQFVILAVGVLSGPSMASESVLAQATEEVTVTAPRVIQDNAGRGPTGIPIQKVSLSYQLSYADLDLTKTVGVRELDRRIETMAKKACKTLDNLYPLSQDPRCLTNAIKGTADQRNQVVAAATPK